MTLPFLPARMGACTRALTSGLAVFAFACSSTSGGESHVGLDAEADGHGAPDARVRDGARDSTPRDAPEDAPAADAAVADAHSDAEPDASTDAPAHAEGDAPAAKKGVFVAVGYGGRHLRSVDDGATWIDDVSLPADAGIGDDILLRTVLFGKDAFLAEGYRVLTSPDGNAWDDHGLLSTNQWIGAALYAGGQYVAVGGYGLRDTSPDGIVWTNHSIDTIATHGTACLSYGALLGGRYVSCNDNGERDVSSDGVTWTAGTGAESTQTGALAFGNSLFVGLSGTAVVVSKDGGTTWSASAPLPFAGASIVFAQGKFSVFGTGHVLTSADGVTWVDNAVSGFTGYAAVAYGDGTYVMLANDGFIRSTDGLTWSALVPVSNTTNALTTLTFGVPGT